MHVNSRILKLKTLLCDTIPLPDNHKYLLVAGSDSHSRNASFVTSHSVVPWRCLAHIRFKTLGGS